jgi:hypothetical protein
VYDLTVSWPLDLWHRVPAATACLLAFAAILAPRVARAGGFELPDLGGQALGRGATFTARADDGLALHYNVAGLARQRGTHILAGGNMVLHQFQFNREGQYPRAGNEFDGFKYPPAVNSGGVGFLPTGVLTTDFGGLDRLTLAVGLLTPSVVPNRAFNGLIPALANGKQTNVPGPARLDVVRNGGILLYPTAGLAFRVTRAFDLGVSFSPVLWTLDSQQSFYLAPDETTCPKPEAVQCITQVKLTGSASAFTGALGAMVRPSPSFQLGAQFKLPTTLKADMAIAADATSITASKQGSGSVELKLPWVLRTGARYIKMDKTFEVYDLEADFTYEGWGSAQGEGMATTIASFGDVKNVSYVNRHNYNNTFSIRAGGAYNEPLEGGVLSVRGGGFFDSTATAPKYTRADYDTLGKFGATIGVGYKIGPVTANLGFAFISSVKRTVTSDAEMGAVNLSKGGKSVDGADAKLSPGNRGTFWGATQIFSLSVDVALETFWDQRGPSWGDPRYEALVPAKKRGEKDKKDDADDKDKDGKDEDKSDEKKTDPENPS